MPERAPLSILLILVLASSLSAGPDSAIEVEIRLHAAFLNSPELSDRYPGDSGLAVAARYLAVELERLGLAGGGQRGSYFREKAAELTPDPADGYLILRTRAGTMTFEPDRDFRPQALTGGGQVAAPVVFAASAGDLTAAVRGRIALFPAGADRIDEAVEAARKLGTAAVLVAPDPRGRDRITFADGRTAIGKVVDRGTEFLFTDRASGRVTRLTKEMVRQIEFSVPAGPPGRAGGEIRAAKPAAIPVLGISARAAGSVLAGDFGGLLAEVEKGIRPRIFASDGGTVRLKMPAKGRRVTIRSVVAILPGTDPALRRETVHVRSVYGGVQGDGSTAAAGLALAAALRRAGRAKRAVRIEFVIDAGQPFAAGPLIVSLEDGSGDLVGVKAAFARVRQLADRPGPAPKRPGKAKPVAAKKPPNIQGTLNAARQARLTGKLDLAAREIAAALAAAPGDGNLYLERGRIRLAAKKATEALLDARNLEKLDPASGRADLLRSEIQDANGETALARRSLEKAVRSRDPEAIVRFVLLLPLEEARGRLAARAYLELVARGPEDSALRRFAAGLLASFRGKPAAAEVFFGQAVDLDPLFGEAWFWRGQMRVILDSDPIAAIKDFDRAERWGIDDPSVWFQRGLCRLRAKMYTLAIREFHAYLAKAPGDASAIYNIACAHALMRNTEEALDWLAKSVEAGFNDAAHARSDPDLASLRGHPRFEGILRSKRTD